MVAGNVANALPTRSSKLSDGFSLSADLMVEDRWSC